MSSILKRESRPLHRQHLPSNARLAKKKSLNNRSSVHAGDRSRDSLYWYTILVHYTGMYGHTYSKSMDLPGKVASPARGQLNRKNENFPVRVRTLYWYTTLVHYTSTLHWYTLLVHYTGTLYWYTILVHYIGTLNWYTILVLVHYMRAEWAMLLIWYSILP